MTMDAKTAEALTSLLERLEKATEPSRELDDAIWLAFTPGATIRFSSYIHTATDQECHVREERIDGGKLQNVPHYTSSLDAALALVERALPGWDYEVIRIGGIHRGGVARGDQSFRCGNLYGAAIALLICAVRALLAQSRDPVELSQREALR